ncbi:hypothetical protein FRC18_009519 [Serendipita sp. 400]|nr:hypothetical protein FRC18_009519 [Serendipita sp. 400]
MLFVSVLETPVEVGGFNVRIVKVGARRMMIILFDWSIMKRIKNTITIQFCGWLSLSRMALFNCPGHMWNNIHRHISVIWLETHQEKLIQGYGSTYRHSRDPVGRLVRLNITHNRSSHLLGRLDASAP